MGDDAGCVEGFDELVIGLGVVEEGADEGDAVRLREREEEEAEVGGGGEGEERRRSYSSIMLLRSS